MLKGLAIGAQGIGTPTSRAEARARKAQSDEELKKAQLRDQEGVVDQEVQIVKEQNKKLLGDMARIKTFDAFRAYNSDYDTRHLNRALADPVIKNLFPDVVSVDKINPANDGRLIRESGFDEGLFDDPELGPNAIDRFVKINKADGTQEISDIVNLQAATGYTKAMTAEELDRLEKRSVIAKNLKTGQGTDTASAKDAVKWGPILNKLQKHPDGSTLTPDELAFHKLMTDKTQGNIAGRVEEVDATTKEMLESVGGDAGWQKLDLSKRSTRLKVGPAIEKIEKLGGLELSAEHEKVITNVNKLLALGEPAAKLTDKETGLIDNVFFRMKKYVPGTLTDDDLRAVQASSGYAAFQNELRKVLYGSVLTPGEIEKFNSAYGTLRQQFPEVMSQFGTMLRGLQADIESVANFNNPYVIEYRLGATSDRVDNLIDNVDSVLDNLVIDTQEVIKPPTTISSDTPVKEKLDRIFK